MTEIDLQRTVKAVRDRIEGGLSGQDVAQPGEVTPVTEYNAIQRLHTLVGYRIACPGCGELYLLRVGPGQPWQVSGDLDAGTLTLTPEFQHLSGCGWHGELREGVFIPV